VIENKKKEKIWCT